MDNYSDGREHDERREDAKPTVVGIGTSAGGLAALKQFFENVPENSNLIFVVVVHLAPEHKSLLADLLQPHVRIPVQQVVETTPLEVNRVYVIPPNANINAIDTHLRLSKLEEKRLARAPIDHFFRTLAATHDGHSVGIILTGTGTDGTLGIREIKAKGGIIIVQDPSEAEFDGMPQSAIATGVVDTVLPVAEIPRAILQYQSIRPRVPALSTTDLPTPPQIDPLPKVLEVLRTCTDRDFSRYKRATIMRRIARRMQLNHLEDVDSYLARLSEAPDEAKSLADDLLITVSSFFRDPEVFQVLEKHILPKIFEQKAVSDSLRVWSVGCATGEEAYSLAMLLVEEASRREIKPKLQVFASDLHKRSLDKARDGFYPDDIQSDVSPERLKRFFRKEGGGYRITRELRDLVVFTPHNLLSDPPFSQIDLISCRNVLIYLERDVQREVVELFHYSLCPQGYMLLGSAEVADAPELFQTQDKKICLYRKRNVPGPEPRLPVFPTTSRHVSKDPQPSRSADPLSYGVSHARLVERYAPPSILVSADDKVVHISERAGRYLTHPGGALTASVFKLVRPELKIELLPLLQTAREKGKPVDSKPIDVQLDGQPRPIIIRIRPSTQPDESGLLAVIFDEQEPEPDRPQQVTPSDAETRPDVQRLRELEEEVHQLRLRLQVVMEDSESSQAELKAANEEMQSTNEELRSTLEELETSKEELQSINEELQTVNQENRHKVEELSQLSNDLHNLLASTEIATLFLDRELRILRFTPKLSELLSVRQTDRGRPVSDLTTRIRYPEMRADAALVLSRLVPIERELQDESGRWYLTRVLPYRSAEDRIEGIVITFVDISSRRNAEDAARSSEQRLALELDAMRRLHGLVSRSIVTADLSVALHDILQSVIEITGANMGNVHLYSRPSGSLEVVAQQGIDGVSVESIRSLAGGENPASGRALASKKRVVISDIKTDPLFTSQGQPASAAEYRAIQSTPLVSRDGQVLGIISTYYTDPYEPSERDLRLLDLYTQQATDLVGRQRAHEEISSSISAQRASEQKYEQLFDSIDEGVCIVEVLMADDGQPYDYRFLDFNLAFEKNTGLGEVVGRTMRQIISNHEPMWLPTFARIARTGQPERFESWAEPLGRYFDLYAFQTGEPSERRVALLCRDVSERKAAEERQEALLRELNHRVKNTLTTVQSIANQTMISAPRPEEFVEKFHGRLAMLAEAHDLLAQSNWEGAELTSILRKLLTLGTGEDRISLTGSTVSLRPQAALNLSLVLYELATNARKYGALSTRNGRLRITWSTATRNGQRYLDLDWLERDGPVVSPPERSGFGTTLIQQGLKGVGGQSVVHFDASGISCRILLPLPPSADARE